MQELQKFIKTAVHFYLANEVNFFLWGGGGGGGGGGRGRGRGKNEQTITFSG